MRAHCPPSLVLEFLAVELFDGHGVTGLVTAEKNHGGCALAKELRADQVGGSICHLLIIDKFSRIHAPRVQCGID